jgi:hypothetical protein
MRVRFAAVLVTTCACSSNPAPVTQPSPSPALSSATPETPVPATAPSSQVVLSPALAEAMGRVRGLLVDPADPAIQAAFSPTFLANIPPDKVKDVFGHAKSDLGSCKDQQVISVESDISAIVRLNCDKGAATVTIAVKPDPPHLIERLLFKPAAP